MAYSAILSAFQQLSMDTYVELYELDTSPLYNRNGVQLGGGTIYYWTSGLIDLRTEGTLPPGVSQSTTVVTLDRQLNLIAGRNYILAVQTNPDAAPTMIPVNSFTAETITISGVSTGVSVLTLASALPATPQPGQPYGLAGTNPVVFQGNTYQALPISMEQSTWTGQGALPRPTLNVSNIGNLAGALVIALSDLLGAKVTKLRTLREFLDDGVSADPTSFADPEVYYFDRLASMTKDHVSFELASALDQQGKKIPGRIIMRDTCSRTYRQYVTDPITDVSQFVYGTCPYNGGAMFDNTNTSTSTPANDVCSLTLNGCLARFGNSAPLPFAGFPGVSITRS